MLKIVNDLNAFASGGGSLKKIGIVISNPCFHAVLLFRLSNILYKIKLIPLAKLVWYINRVLFSVDIDYRADLAGGFRLVHGVGVVIGKNVKSVGKLTVYQGVTIGGSGKKLLFEGKEIDQPVFFDNVTLYTDVKIFGSVILKENTYIKAGQLITKSFD